MCVCVCVCVCVWRGGGGKHHAAHLHGAHLWNRVDGVGVKPQFTQTLQTPYNSGLYMGTTRLTADTHTTSACATHHGNKLVVANIEFLKESEVTH